MTMTKAVVATVACVASAIALTAFATSHGQPADSPAWFSEFDADQDGIVTRQEALEASRAARRFDRMDADGDGRLTAEEAGGYGERRHAAAVEKFKAIDRDADGALSREEVEGELPNLASNFDELDHDGNGELSTFEIHHPPHLLHHGMCCGKHHGYERAPEVQSSVYRL